MGRVRWARTRAGAALAVVLLATAPLPRSFLRWLATRACVHLYHDDPEDSLYASRQYLTLAAGARAGPRTLRLPRKATVVDLVSGKTVATNAHAFSVEFKPTEARMFFLKAPGR